jgi:GDP-4-dehydro-6-deoxy-D-mannose reductase
VSDTVLVTGATGFIGKPLIKRLQGEGLNVIAIGSAQGDIADPATLRPFENRDVRYVVHLAGRSFVPESWTDPQGFLRTNVLGAFNVLEFCRRANASLTFMSAYLYGVPDRLPITEDAPALPNNPYALSKHLAEEVCRFYAAHFGIAVTVLRPFNVYGPGQPERFLVPSVLRQLLKAKGVEVLDLEPRRDWLYIDDLIDATAAARRGASGYNVYNLGSGVSTSVAELIRVAQEAAGTALPVTSKSAARVNEINDTVADIGKARTALGWSPRITLHEGIRRCLQAMSDKR